MTKFSFFFPDNKDFVDPKFDGRDSSRTKHPRVYDDDVYPHQILNKLPYNGMLVSLAGVGTMQKRGKYYETELTEDFYFKGAREFLRLNTSPQLKSVMLMGDCGAFDYANEYEPPFTIDELIEFYERGKFDYGISLDHIVFAFTNDKNALDEDTVKEAKRRIAITLKNAEEFLEKSKGRSFKPYGVAHGYDIDSFVASVKALEDMGYRRITIGGMVKSKTDDLLKLLDVLGQTKHPDTVFHLLGICRFENIPAYVKAGVTSADSTSPLMQGLKGGKYYWINEESKKVEEYVSIRLRQCDHDNVQKHIEKNRDSLQALIIQMQRNDEFDIDLSNSSLSVNECLKRLETDCISKLIEFDKTGYDIDGTFKAIMAYEKVTNDAYLNESKHAQLAKESEKYRKFLNMRLWKECRCGICEKGLMNIIFRSNQTNRRRGIHNLAIVTQHKDIVLSTLSSQNLQQPVIEELF
ncbi:tRNA-guanine transglycosylase DpdA [Photobacterium leiognathi]|uniref:tRNA-guanine transglycosylase DpdA n=1 Tax=Photobacterium leiognathi TaxID=553611 RepID=UPI0029817A90|nr:tRNA-guanine transglycosylase DpdA [Photobacterium leiognathi]